MSSFLGNLALVGGIWRNELKLHRNIIKDIVPSSGCDFCHLSSSTIGRQTRTVKISVQHLQGMNVPINNSSARQSEKEELSASRFSPRAKIGGYTWLQGRASPHLFSTSVFFSHFHSDGPFDDLIPQFPKVELMADKGH